MTATRLYLVTPPVLTEAALRDLAGLLDAGHDVACVRLDVAATDESDLRRAADAVRALAHARDVNIVIADHVGLVAGLGLDGVHLTAGHRHVREARKALGGDAIVGAACGASRHDGMTAAEIGADYVSFGPLAPTPLGTGAVAPLDLFAWWSEMIETPVVAEGAVSPEIAAAVAPHTDFIALGPELWSHPAGPRAALDAIAAAIAAAIA